MKTNKYLLYFVLCPAMLLLAACEPKALTEEEVFGGSLEQQLQAENPEGYDLYNLNDFLDKFMTEEGNFHSDSTMYRSRSTNGNGIYLYSLDTLPANGRGIYIRGRVTTDDFGGNFYKALVIQQVTDWATGEEPAYLRGPRFQRWYVPDRSGDYDSL